MLHYAGEANYVFASPCTSQTLENNAPKRTRRPSQSPCDCWQLSDASNLSAPKDCLRAANASNSWAESALPLSHGDGWPSRGRFYLVLLWMIFHQTASVWRRITKKFTWPRKNATPILHIYRHIWLPVYFCPAACGFAMHLPKSGQSGSPFGSSISLAMSKLSPSATVPSKSWPYTMSDSPQK